MNSIFKKKKEKKIMKIVKLKIHEKLKKSWNSIKNFIMK